MDVSNLQPETQVPETQAVVETEVNSVSMVSASIKREHNSVSVKCSDSASLLVALSKAPDITEVYLKLCKIDDDDAQTLGQMLKVMTTLKDVYIHHCTLSARGFKDLSHQMFQNKSIRFASFMANNLDCECAKSLAASLTGNQSVAELNLSDNELQVDGAEAIGRYLESGHTLHTLDLTNNRLKKAVPFLCEVLSKDTTLKKLVLRDNGIIDEEAEHLAHCIRRNCTLTELDLERNNIGRQGVKLIARAICNNNTLLVLNLNKNDVDDEGAKELSIMLRHNNTLSKLCIANTKVGKDGANELRAGLAENFTITEMDVSFERFPFIAPAFQVLLLRNKEKLSGKHPLSFSATADIATYMEWRALVINPGTPIPNQLAQLVNLERLELSHYGLEEVPKVLSYLTNLKVLDLRSNRLESLDPQVIGSLTNLTELYLSGNCLDYLPYQMHKLTKLTTLHLWCNPLKQLKSAKARVFGESFEEFHLQQHITPPPKTTLWEYLRNLDAACNTFTKYYKAKVMLVGREKAGKTTLLNTLEEYSLKRPAGQLVKKFTRQHVSCLEPPTLTDGIHIRNLYILDENTKRMIHYSAWDFAGQELYFTTHVFFLTPKTIYLVVFNMSDFPDRMEDVDYWVRSIHVRVGREAPVILVGTHCHSYFAGNDSPLEREQVKKQLTRKYGQMISAVAFVDAKTNAGKYMRALCTCLSDVAKKRGLIETSFPAVYEVIEGRLQALAKTKDEKKIVSYKEYRNVIRGCGVHDDEIGKVTEFLMSRGQVLYFGKEDEALKDIVFLNPQFLCKVFADVVSYKTLYSANLQQNGMMKRKMLLNHIWAKYPPSLREKLLRLLEIFEILVPYRTIMNNNGAEGNANKAEKYSSLRRALSAHTYSWDDDENVLLIPSLFPSEPPPDAIKYFLRLDIARASIPQQAHNGNNANQAAANPPAGILENEEPQQSHHEPPVELNANVLLPYERVYVFKFLPLGFVQKLIVRCLELRDIEVLAYWKRGLVARRQTETAQISFDARSYQLNIFVIGTRNASLLAAIVSAVDNLIKTWFSKVQYEIFCRFIYKGTKYNFNARELAVQIAAGSLLYTAEDGRTFSIERIAPDLCLNDLERVVINHSDLPPQEMWEILGQGGFGTVYKLRYRGEDIALKCFDSTTRRQVVSDVNESLQQLTDFADEARMMAYLGQVKHENVVQLKGILKEPIAIAMEYIPHGDLHKYIKRNASNGIPLLFKLRILHDVAKGMNFLHQLVPPVVHQDLRSPNVLLVSEDVNAEVVAKVTDFGLAAQMYSKFGLSRNQTFQWLAPEVWQGKGFGIKADIYSFAIVMWEVRVATGDLPFHEVMEGRHNEDVRNMIANNNARPTIPPIDPNVHDPVEARVLMEFDHLMRRCWAANPDERPEFFVIVSALEAMIRMLPGGLQALARAPHQLERDAVVLAQKASSVRVWDSTQTQVYKGEKSDAICIAMKPGTSQLWLGYSDNHLRIWDYRNDTHILLSNGLPASAPQVRVARRITAILPVGPYMWLLSEEDQALAIYENTNCVARVPLPAHPLCIAVDPSQQYAYIGCSDGHLVLCSLTCGPNSEKLILDKVHFGGPLLCIAVDEKRIWVGGGIANNGEVRVFAREDFRMLHAWAAHSSRVKTIVCVGDSMIWTGGEDSFIKVWKIREQNEWLWVMWMRDLSHHTERINRLASVDNGNTVISVSESIVIWDAQKFVIKKIFPRPTRDTLFFDIVMQHDSTFFSVSRQNFDKKDFTREVAITCWQYN